MPARKVLFGSCSPYSSSWDESTSTSSTSSSSSSHLPSSSLSKANINVKITRPKKRGYRFDEAIAAKQALANLPSKKIQESQSQSQRQHAPAHPNALVTSEPNGQDLAHKHTLIHSAFHHASILQSEAHSALRELVATEREIEIARARHRGTIISDSNSFNHDFHVGYEYPIFDPCTTVQFQEIWANGWTVQELDKAGVLARGIANRKVALAEEGYASARALAAALGHPCAVAVGGWRVLDIKTQGQEDEILTRLSGLCHSEDALQSAGYAMNLTRAPAPSHHQDSPSNSSPKPKKRKAISLDCAFVGVGPLDRDALAQLCAIDVLTGEVLLDVLVTPDEPLTHYRTKYGGITDLTYHAYREHGLVLGSVEDARRALFEVMDSETLLVGFALHNDLFKLGISHSRIIDTQVVTREAVESRYGRELKRRWGLRDLCWTFLSKEVQVNDSGHDCLEDAFAPRELVYWLLDQRNQGVYQTGVDKEVRDKIDYWDANILNLLEWEGSASL